METANCRKCGENVEIRAKVCPACGATRPALRPIHYVAGVAFVAVVGGLIAGPLILAPARVWQPVAADACDASHAFVADQLATPATAKFGTCDEGSATAAGEQRWKIASTVDAQNGYGAVMRKHYRVTMVYERDKWIADDLVIE